MRQDQEEEDESVKLFFFDFIYFCLFHFLFATQVCVKINKE